MPYSVGREKEGFQRGNSYEPEKVAFVGRKKTHTHTHNHANITSLGC